MNKKILTLTLLTLVTLTIPLIGTAQACRWNRWWCKPKIDVYTRTPPEVPFGPGDPVTTVKISDVPGDIDIFKEGKIWIRSGTVRTLAYGYDPLGLREVDGPLGTGTEVFETKISITHISENITNPAIPPLGIPAYTGPGTGHGHGIYKMTLTIDDGPHGSGTLWGYGRYEWEFSFLGDYTERYFYQWGSFKLQHGTEDFAGVKVLIDTYDWILFGTWHTKTTVISHC